jgi:hypothetical protein
VNLELLIPRDLKLINQQVCGHFSSQNRILLDWEGSQSGRQVLGLGISFLQPLPAALVYLSPSCTNALQRWWLTGKGISIVVRGRSITLRDDDDDVKANLREGHQRVRS